MSRNVCQSVPTYFYRAPNLATRQTSRRKVASTETTRGLWWILLLLHFIAQSSKYDGSQRLI